MTKLDKETIMNKAIKIYGSMLQETVAMEEMAELIKEISKNIRGANNRKQLLEELADVNIMLKEIQLIHKISDEELEDEVVFKLVRLNNRLNEDEHK